ncbi:MAG: putative bifunctional diguanylate cyclase/phosphodiesterase [Maritimibacter sp.]
MSVFSTNKQNDTLKRIRLLFVGPQLAAFLPAITLGAYWFGGEGFLLIVAVVLPAIFAVTGTFNLAKPRRSKRDPITGLGGKSELLKALDHAIRVGIGKDCDPPVCIVLEVDNIQGITAQFGEAGEETILRACAERINATLRETDTLFSIAPGQFAIVVPKTPRVDLEAMIQMSGRLQDAMGQPISLDSARVLLTATIGFCLPSRVPSETGAGYFYAADSALEEARNAGPGSIRAFARGMRTKISVPDNVTAEVVKALEEGQIRPWFQPQLSTHTGALTGFEALARWEHPEKGNISPASFLPAIAEAGMFDRLGEVILFKSLSALREWDKAGLHVPNVAVNFSADELRNPRLFEKVKWELDRFEFSPDRLVVEVLENVVAQSDDDTTTRNIAALSRLGCGIDLDDFGTGHASISNIRRFDVNRIKIDRSFVTRMDTDRDQQNMVAAILTMAERLELETLGEGVETHGEHAMLAQLGCGHVQGYSIARPMPFEDTIAWITQHESKVPETPTFPKRAGKNN